jgi:hypothetical protein
MPAGGGVLKAAVKGERGGLGDASSSLRSPSTDLFHVDDEGELMIEKLRVGECV